MARTMGEHLKEKPAPWSFAEPVHALGYLLLAGVFSLRLGLFKTRWFNPDEFEHLHASWYVAGGAVPYRDFFEHHTPWFWYLLAPLVAGAASDASSASHALVLARATSLVLSAAALCALIWLGRVWNGFLCGVVAALCIAGLKIFFLKTIDIRPDVPALLLWIGCLVGLGYALRADDSRAWRRALLAAGLCLGATIMFNQKILFALPGLGLAGLAWIAFASPGTARGARVRACAWFVVGLCVPIAATWGYFTARGAGWAFLHDCFLLNARWKAAEPPEPWLQQLATEEWPVLLLAAGGVGVSLWELAGGSRRDWPGLVFIASGISLLLGSLVTPAAFAQYYLPLLPLLALFAARFVTLANERMPATLRWVLLCPVLVLLQITPVRHALSYWEWRSDEQLAQLAYVFAHSTPSDQVLDGWRGLGVFRPHTWHYFCLPADVRGMLPPEALDAFLDDLEAGRVKPKLVVGDINLQQLSPRLVAFVVTRYTRGYHDIWIRRPDV